MYKTCLYASLSTVLMMIMIAAISCSSTLTAPTTILYTPKIERGGHKVVSKLRNAYKSAVSIMHPTNDRSMGSGVVVRNQKGYTMLVLTNYHVARHGDKKSIWIRSIKNGWKKKMNIVRVAKDLDIALLESKEVQIKTGATAVIASRKPLIGEELWVIGSPRGNEKNITKGILSSIVQSKTKKKKKYKLYRTDTDIFFGNSGGGVYNKDGQLTGLVVALEMIPGGLFAPPSSIPGGGLCISLKHVRDFLLKGK